MATQLHVFIGGQHMLPWQTTVEVCKGQDFRILPSPGEKHAACTTIIVNQIQTNTNLNLF
jgi:hypothetical protein